jgi:hypothetical protein
MGLFMGILGLGIGRDDGTERFLHALKTKITNIANGSVHFNLDKHDL